MAGGFRAVSGRAHEGRLISPSASIRVRDTQTGRTYQVRYRIHGRGKLWSGGTFKTLKDARSRRDYIISELAAGRDPRTSLTALANTARPAKFADQFQAFIDSRRDVGAGTIAAYGAHKSSLGALGKLNPPDITPADIQDWIGRQKLAPASLANYLSTIKQVLDYCDVVPNPARDRRIKLPATPREEVQAPTRAEWDKLQPHTKGQVLLALRVLEATGLRVGELTSLTWGDIDFATGRFRVSRARTKTSGGQRWVPVPPTLLDDIGDLLPFEDRARDRRVFTASDAVIRHRLEHACKHAGTVHYTPHDLRHRRVSLWFAHGFDDLVISRWAGHSRASISKDVYGHVIAAGDEWESFWRAAYVAERSSGVSPVWPTEEVSS